jgi:hypothetical protein
VLADKWAHSARGGRFSQVAFAIAVSGNSIARLFLTIVSALRRIRTRSDRRAHPGELAGSAGTREYYDKKFADEFAAVAHSGKPYMRATSVKNFFSRSTFFFASVLRMLMRAQFFFDGTAAPCLAAPSGQPPEPAGSRRKARGVDGERRVPSHNGVPAITPQS